MHGAKKHEGVETGRRHQKMPEKAPSSRGARSHVEGGLVPARNDAAAVGEREVASRPVQGVVRP